MKAIGFWPPESKFEKFLLNGILTYTLFAIGLAIWIEGTEFYLGIGDIYVSSNIFVLILIREAKTLSSRWIKLIV